MFVDLPIVCGVFMLPSLLVNHLNKCRPKIPIHLINSISCKLSKNECKNPIAPLASLLMIYSSQGQPATPTAHDPAGSDATEADNTKRNSSAQNKSTDTAEKQSNSKDDLPLTQKIRQAVMKDVDER
jgi:hypothetical protein